MRTIHQKWILIAGLVTISVLTLFFRPAFAGQSTTKQKETVNLKDARASVNQAILTVNQQEKKGK